MISVLDPWPEGTEANTSQDNIELYIQNIAKNRAAWKSGRCFHTRVDEVKKSEDGQKWLLRTVTLDKGRSPARLIERLHEFDAVVVASGHYNMPRVPDIEGLNEWRTALPAGLFTRSSIAIRKSSASRTLLSSVPACPLLDICRELGGDFTAFLSERSRRRLRRTGIDAPVQCKPHR